MKGEAAVGTIGVGMLIAEQKGHVCFLIMGKDCHLAHGVF